tara:strand:+ start:1515 stop:1694 length:180 start_codon:yes stop_codon:yes gene_type:complete
MDWEKDREEYMESGRFTSPDEISRKILERAEARSTVTLLYLCLLIFAVGILSLVLYFLV